MADIGSGTKPIAFGDFSRAYTIVDRVNLSIMRDPYSQATSGNIRYVARRRVGGTVVLPEAIRLQNISS
jgi:HK97 family phage major capsid protein